MINRPIDNGWRHDEASSYSSSGAPERDAQRRFEEERRLARARAKKSHADIEMPAGMPAMPPWMLLTAAGGHDQGNAPNDPQRDAQALAGTAVDAIDASMFAPTAMSMPMSSAPAGLEWQGRLLNGPWAGLELQVSMQASAATVTLRASSRQQYERLARIGEAGTARNDLIRWRGQADDLFLQLELSEHAAME